MKISCCFLFLTLFSSIVRANNLRLLYPAYKLIEDAVMGNPEVKFLLRQTFFPSTNYRYWQVDGAEIIPIHVCVTLHNSTEQQPGIQGNLIDVTEKDTGKNCTGQGSWDFHWTNSLLLNILPCDILLAMDTTMTTIIYSDIAKSSRYRKVALDIHLNEFPLSCTPSLDDIEQAFILFLSTVSIIHVTLHEKTKHIALESNLPRRYRPK